MAPSVWELTSRIWPGPVAESTGTTSSPVERIATTGLLEERHDLSFVGTLHPRAQFDPLTKVEGFIQSDLPEDIRAMIEKEGAAIGKPAVSARRVMHRITTLPEFQLT